MRRRRYFYGWVVVGAAFVSHLLNYGTLTVAFGIFFPFMADALGMSRGVLASAGVVTRLASAAVAPLIGPLVDRHGPRLFTTLGVLSLAAGAVILGLARGAADVFVGYGVVMALASVTLGELTGDATVARWFVRRRGRALAVATMGLSSAGIVVPLPLAWLIATHGWRRAWMVLAVVVLVLGLLAAAAIRRRPEDFGLLPDGEAPTEAARAGRADAERSLGAREAARTPAFWLLVLGTNLAGLALFGVNLHLFSSITDKGVGAAPAAAIVTYLYVLHTVAKPVWAVIAERVHVRYCLAACYVGGAAGVVVLLVTSSVAGLLVFATIYGLTRGAQSFVTSLAWADYFGRDAQGAIRGLASPFRFVASAAGPVVGGFLYDLTGGYEAPFAVFAAAFACGGLVALAARPPAGRRAPAAA
ncbi:MAG: MFS transporter [Candidatus Rokuibacteriota bacterium]